MNKLSISAHSNQRGSFALTLVLPLAMLLVVAAAIFIYQAQVNVESIGGVTVRREVSEEHAQVARLILPLIIEEARSSLRGNPPRTFTDRFNEAMTSATTNARSGNLYQGNTTATWAGEGGLSAEIGAAIESIAATPATQNTALPGTRFLLRSGRTTYWSQRGSWTVELSQSQNTQAEEGLRVNQSVTQKRYRVTAEIVPQQFAVQGGEIALTNSIDGSVIGRSLNLSASVTGSAIATESLTWASGVSVGGNSLPAINTLQLASLQAQNNTRSATLLSEKTTVAVYPLEDATQIGGVPQAFLTPTATDAWTVLTHPYYRCDARSGALAIDPTTLPVAGTIVPVPVNFALADGQGTLTARRTETTSLLTMGARRVIHPTYGTPAVVLTIDSTTFPTYSGRQHIFINGQVTGSATPRESFFIEIRGQNLSGPFSVVTPNPIIFARSFNVSGRNDALLMSPLVMSKLTNTATLEFTGQRGSLLPLGSMNLNSYQTGNVTKTLDVQVLEDLPVLARPSALAPQVLVVAVEALL